MLFILLQTGSTRCLPSGSIKNKRNLMQITISKYFRPMLITGCVCLAAALVLSSCSKKPQQAILGKWNAEESKSLVEFRPDGTVTTLENGTTSTAKYKFLSDTNFEMEVTAMMNTNKIVVQM